MASLRSSPRSRCSRNSTATAVPRNQKLHNTSLTTKLESRFDGVEFHVGELHSKFGDVELDIAMEVTVVHAEEAIVRAKKNALYSAQVESLEEVVEPSKK
ncbi:hypothetical protein HAX54_021058, partial [Datura stramonium]|nr:hypothetical protein [Datura stramonium]